MSKIKIIISSILILGLGVAIGWILKPSVHTEKGHNHESVTDGNMSAAEEEIWTCSMHPQVRQNEPGICPLCEMDLIPLDNTMTNDDPTILMMSEEAVKLAQIQTTIVGESEFSNRPQSHIEVEGSVELNEKTINLQSSHIAGRIEAIDVTFEGQYIKAGQKIATIYSTDLLSASQELITAAKYEDRVEGIKESSIQKLKNWKITQSQIDQILTTQKPVETIDIYAEQSGYVMSKKVALGDYVGQGQALYTIAQINNLWLYFNVYESDLSNISIGSAISFQSPSTGSETFKARVSYIDPLLENATRTASVRADFKNIENRLKPGMLLTGIIHSKSDSQRGSDQLTIPKSSVLWTGKTSVVYIKQKETEVPTFEFREIEVGQSKGDHIIVLKGLSNGEEIVTHGAFAVDAASQLNNNRSMMNRGVTIKQEAKRDVIPDFQIITAEEFKKQLDEVADAYIDIKNGLVNTDNNITSAKAENLLMALEKVDMKLLTDEDSHMYWMEQSNIIKNHGDMISSSTDVEYQRKQFEYVSDAVIRSVQAFGTSGKTYFVQFCPMAFNNKGANWLASEEQIRNPYFGDKMMKCGSVKRKLD